MEVLAVEVPVDAFSLLALEICQPVHSQNMRVWEEVMGLEVEKCATSLRQGSLQSNQTGDVFVVLSQMVQQGDNLLTEDCCLYCLVACVHRMWAETIWNVILRDRYILVISWILDCVISPTEPFVNESAYLT